MPHRVRSAHENIHVSHGDAPSLTGPAVLAATAVAPHHEDHEESIEDYMAALLNRVRRKANGEDVVERPTPAVVESASPRVDSSAVEEAPLAIKELPLPARAPAKIDLTALREVSRSHSELVLSQHKLSQHKTATSRHGLVAVMALGAGVALTFLSRHLGAVYLPGIVCFAVAIVWGVQFAGATLAVGSRVAPRQTDASSPA